MVFVMEDPRKNRAPLSSKGMLLLLAANFYHVASHLNLWSLIIIFIKIYFKFVSKWPQQWILSITNTMY